MHSREVGKVDINRISLYWCPTVPTGLNPTYLYYQICYSPFKLVVIIMKVSDLRPLVKVDDIELEIFEKAEPRQVTTKFGNKELTVCDAKGKDETGEIQLTLWNEEIELVPLNAKIRITNGYVKEWNGALQLSAGKYGKIEVIQ